MLKTRLITYTDQKIWNDFVADSPNSPVLQSFEWGELKSKFGWQPLRIAIEDKGSIIAGISILKRQLPLIKRPIYYAPNGPILNFYDRDLLTALLSAIEEAADRDSAVSLKIDPLILESEAEPLKLLTASGFVRSPKQVQPRATYHLDLTPDLDTLLMSFDEKTRYNIRLAEKKGVVVKEDTSEKGIEIFHQIYQETSARNQFLIHPLKYYRAVRETLFTKGMGTNFIAYYNGRPIASVIIFCFGSQIWYMYGSSSDEHRNLMPNHLLHWEVIKWAKAKNYKIYDLWGIPVKPKIGHPLFGVYRFKKGFNGKRVVYIGAYDFPYSPLFYHAVERGVAWWQKVRSLLTKGKIEDSLGE